jgi:pantothenate kinase
MDGFHLADAELHRQGLDDRKGAPETFDRTGYAALLRRLRVESQTVYAPVFDRDLEDSIAAALAVDPDVSLVVTEGNYLLVWPEVRGILDEIWYLDPPSDRRVEGLIARHIEFGKAAATAADWVHRSDEANARLIELHRHHADLVVDNLWA